MKSFLHKLAQLSSVQQVLLLDLDGPDPERLALVLAEPGRAGLAEIYGIASLVLDPNIEHGEYAILVRGDLTGAGLGIFLMRRIIDYARRRGLREIWGDVLRDNKTMLKMCRVLGFTQEPVEEDPSIVRVRLDLSR